MTYLDRPQILPPFQPCLLWQIARSLPRGYRVAIRSAGNREVMQATFLNGDQRTVDEFVSKVPIAPQGNTWLHEFDQQTLRRAIALPGDRWGVIQIPGSVSNSHDDGVDPILSEVFALPKGRCLIVGTESLSGVVRALSEVWGAQGWEAAVSSTSDEAFERLTLDMVRKHASRFP